VKQKAPLTDYRDVLEACSKNKLDVVLVGGSAVSVWVEHYKAKLADRAPVTTKDLDLFGGEYEGRVLADSLGGKFIRNPRKGGLTNVIGRVILDEEDPMASRIVDILWDIRGVSDRDLKDEALTAYIPAIGIDLKVASPISLLAAKSANLANLEQDGRNDLAQLHALMSLLPLHLSDEKLTSSARAMEGLEEVIKISLSGTGMEVRKQHNICFPRLVRNCLSSISVKDNAKWMQFTEKRVPHWLSALRKKDGKLGINLPYPAFDTTKIGESRTASSGLMDKQVRDFD